jgi:hypothetical protein
MSVPVRSAGKAVLGDRWFGDKAARLFGVSARGGRRIIVSG